MRNAHKIGLLLLAASACGFAASAQKKAAVAEDTSIFTKEHQLDQFVITGLSNAQKLKDALSTYQVVTKAMMNAQGAVTVSDALRNQLNIDIGNDRMLGSTTSMQGMKGNKVKLLIDGMPVNGRENGEIDLGQINLNNVDRIEIVQGPMSVVYGTDALGGVINVITAKPKTPWGIKAGTYYETIGKYNFDIAGNYRIKERHQVSLGGGRNFFDGWQTIDILQRAYLWWPKEQYLANAAYDYKAASSFRLRFATDFVHEKLSNKDIDPTVNSLGANAQDQYFYNTRVNSRLQMNGNVGKHGSWQMQNGYSLYNRRKIGYIKNMVTLTENLSSDTSAFDTTVFHDYNFRGSYTHALKNFTATAGYDINLEEGRSGKIADSASSIQDYAVYGSAEVSFFDTKLKLQPALRYSYNNIYNTPLIPSFNILYSASDAVQIRASYAKGFRAPSLKEMYLLFVDANHQIEGNPNLRPETGYHLQGSVSWKLYEEGQNFLKLLGTGFYNDVTDQISLYQPPPSLNNPSTYATYTNIEDFRNVMGTLQAEGQWKDIYGQVGFTVAQLLSGGNSSIGNSYQATAMAQYNWKKTGLLFSTFYKYFGRQPRIEPTIDGSSAYNGIFTPYSFWDASVEKSFWKKNISLTAGIKNILNVTNGNVIGASSGGIHSGGGPSLSTGRSAFASLRLNLN